MKISIKTREPFSFEQTLTFIRRFPPCQQEVIVTDDSVTAAIALGGRAWPFTLRPGLVVEVPDGAPPALARRAAEFVGADDDVSTLYAAAEHDPAFRPVIRALHGLHQVRFLGLEEIAVYCVMMQRTPIARATQLKRKFLDAFGLQVTVGERTLRAMPELADLAELPAAAITKAIGHKGERVAAVVRGVAELGEPFLRTAPYAAAKQALLAIPGVGAFSATAILLRGLGRVDELPSLAMFERDGRKLYGAAWDEDAIARRYGDQIGYWSFYLKTGAARLSG